MFSSRQQFFSDNSRMMRASEGILREEYVRKVRRVGIPLPKMPMRRPHSIPPGSPTESMSSSSSWSSSQESLNMYGSSPETPRLSGLKPQDRLRRIRESFNQQQLNRMEVDEESNFNPVINRMKENTRPSPISQHYSPLSQHYSPMITDDSDDTKSVRSVSLRLKRYRQARTEAILSNQNNDDNYRYPYRSWQCDVSSPNKCFYSNRRLRSDTENSTSIEYKNPQWLIPRLSSNPLRRPYTTQR